MILNTIDISTTKKLNGHCGFHQWNQTSNYTHQADQQLMGFIKVVY